MSQGHVVVERDSYMRAWLVFGWLYLASSAETRYCLVVCTRRCIKQKKI